MFQRVTNEIKRQRALALVSHKTLQTQLAINKNVKNGWYAPPSLPPSLPHSLAHALTRRAGCPVRRHLHLM